MTNIIAAVVVTVVTNVSEDGPKILVPASVPARDYRDFSYHGVVDAVFRGEWVRDSKAIERWWTTNVVERTVLKFDWNGSREVIQERTLSSVTATQRLEWTTH